MKLTAAEPSLGCQPVNSQKSTTGEAESVHHCPLTYCWSTAPTATATSEASVMIDVGASGIGWNRSEAMASVKAVEVSLVHVSASEGHLVCLSI